MIVTNKEYVRGGYPVLPSVRYIVKRKLLIDNDLMFIKGVLHEDIPFCHMLIYKAKKPNFIAFIYPFTYLTFLLRLKKERHFV